LRPDPVDSNKLCPHMQSFLMQMQSFQILENYSAYFLLQLVSSWFTPCCPHHLIMI